ncbi:MAG: family 20 glycosylhydrolase, partial [Bacteroidota bacterium]
MTTTRTLSLILLSILFLACDQSTYLVEESMPVNILPTPKQISQSEQVLVLSETSSILASDPSLLPLAQLFSDELQSLQGFQLKASLMSGQSSDIIFKLDPSLNASQYEIAIEQEVILRGGSYQALVMAKSSLLQLAGTHAEALAFPVLQIQDETETHYIGLMLDLARQWHTIETIKKTIDLAAFYKINYLQLHFTDYQSYTLPSRHYPLLSTPDRHYRFAELKDLEAYSQLRGVTIIPEIDVPGHSSPFVKSYPDIFALEDSARNPYIINMGREAIYPALDSLIGEVLSIFQATPYLHIGGDEAYLEGVIDDPEVQNYIQTHALEQDAH